MKSLNEMLKPIKETLLSVSENVGYHTPIDGSKTHIIYYEDSEASAVAADNIKRMQAIQRSVDLYAEVKDIGMFDEIQNALNEKGISFSLNSVQKNEPGTNKFIHYEWIFEVS